jgi:imidazolonepropionase-like amidohydrolase
VVADAAAAEAAVNRFASQGYDFIKVYNRLPRDAYFAIAKTAKARGLPFAGHVPTAVSAIEASDAGQKSIEHLTGIFLAASRDEAQLRERTLAVARGGEANTGISRDTRAAMRTINEGLLASYDEQKAAAVFAAFVNNGTWQCPTLTVLRSMASLDDAQFTGDARLKYLPRQIRDRWNPANDPLLATKPADDYAFDRRVLKKQMEIVGAMHKAGVRILAGTDVLNPFAFPGFSLHDELALLVQAGLSRADALRAATINPAIYMGMEKTAGSVDPGRNADVVLLDANPLDDIAATTRIHAVIVRGRLLDRAALDSMLAHAETISK